MKIRPFIVGVTLCVLSVAVLGLNAIESPRPPPHTLSAISTIRIVLGLPVVLFVPAVFVVPFLLRPSLGRRGKADGPLDLLWTLIAAAGLNVGFHFLHFQLLNLVGQGSSWVSLGVIALVECVAGLAVLHFKGSHLEFDPVSWKLLRGLGYGILVLGFVLAGMGPKLQRDSSWYFYNTLMDVGWEATEDRGAIEIRWADGTPFVDGVEFVRRSRIMQLVIENNSSEMQRVPLLFLVHGPVGTNIWLKRTTPPGRIWDVPQIATATPLEEGGSKVERYYHWGTASITGLECRDDPTEPPYNPNQICEGIQVPPEGVVLVELHIRLFESHWGNDPNHTWVAAWARLSTGEVQDDLGSRGHQHMHPYQLLNVTENVRWAEEIAGGAYVLPGRPTRDETASQEPALAQPPALSYVYAPARRLLSEQTAVAAALLVAMLLALVVLGLKGIEDETGKAPLPVLGVTLGFTALQWGQLMVRDGSMNFPDNLYALGLAVSVVALVSGRTRVFLVWAVLTTLLRYPGAVVIGMAGLALLVLAPKRRVETLDGLARYALLLAGFCGLMLLAGIRSNQLDQWFYSLYWETIPEHFRNNAEALPFLLRPMTFLLKWASVGGAVLLLGVPFRGLLSRTALATALAYLPFLAFIDHHSNHYFLPLIGLAGIAACASIAHLDEKRQKQYGTVLAIFSFMLFVAGPSAGVRAVDAWSDGITVDSTLLPPADEGGGESEDLPEPEDQGTQ